MLKSFTRFPKVKNSRTEVDFGYKKNGFKSMPVRYFPNMKIRVKNLQIKLFNNKMS